MAVQLLQTELCSWMANSVITEYAVNYPAVCIDSGAIFLCTVKLDVKQHRSVAVAVTVATARV